MSSYYSQRSCLRDLQWHLEIWLWPRLPQVEALQRDQQITEWIFGVHVAASPNCNPGLLPNPAPRFHLNTSICRQCRQCDKHCQKNYCPDAGQDVPLWVMGQESGLEQAARDYSWGKQFKVRNDYDICKFNQILLTLSFLIHTPIWHQNLDMKKRF